MYIAVELSLLIASAREMGQVHAMCDPLDPWTQAQGQGAAAPGPCPAKTLPSALSRSHGSHATLVAWAWPMS